jgi:S-adenosylmethionine hydrolase
MLKRNLVAVILTFSCWSAQCQSRALVLQTDFGLKDAAVSAMKGVAYGVSSDLHIFDHTHEIPAYNIWEAAYRLNQAAGYWPSGTVFVSVVDPGVGSERKSIVAKTKSGHYFVTPDNGTLTLIAESLGIEKVRIIDEAVNRLKNSEQSYTFHGRDVYAFTGARLAAGIITFEQVGPELKENIVTLSYQKATLEKNKIWGTIDILDVQYGNIWTNIHRSMVDSLHINFGEKVHVKVVRNDKQVYESDIIYGKTFADVPAGKPVAYINSLLRFSVGINQGSFSETYNVKSGPEWKIVLTKAGK